MKIENMQTLLDEICSSATMQCHLNARGNLSYVVVFFT